MRPAAIYMGFFAVCKMYIAAGRMLFETCSDSYYFDSAISSMTNNDYHCKEKSSRQKLMPFLGPRQSNFGPLLRPNFSIFFFYFFFYFSYERLFVFFILNIFLILGLKKRFI